MLAPVYTPFYTTILSQSGPLRPLTTSPRKLIDEIQPSTCRMQSHQESVHVGAADPPQRRLQERTQSVAQCSGIQPERSQSSQWQHTGTSLQDLRTTGKATRPVASQQCPGSALGFDVRAPKHFLSGRIPCNSYHPEIIPASGPAMLAGPDLQ
ncbi:hypothetical protein HRR83_002296 [Exophiala dermatitidis]|uniref:Uncharacterized protein n=1 Tax=Exophiala dermatitidis TaxID=5970 RepID=A0AAN6EW12_EXODE|nr:hypothetical protein HRR74_002373 [Exophiala dermatitidis]KAJ4525552.1 hypothetical protein HRR73_002282 [Exophiala dermatitidis]KAJ4536869.1 hypothetical protein HRR76_004895 [Exophiala dermatitidis]KAJ4555530.1 hypothetical protein HRR77_001460 [Exophiala dermatitidis]KAJ4568834.1 hypothetical protein HRR81_006491 [Exophiala dermatitidis]